MARRQRPQTINLNFKNSRWRQPAAILQIVKSLYLNEKSSDFDKIWYTHADLELDDNQVIKYKVLKFKMADGRCKGVRCPPIFSLSNLINAGWLVRKCVNIYTSFNCWH